MQQHKQRLGLDDEDEGADEGRLFTRRLAENRQSQSHLFFQQRRQ